MREDWQELRRQILETLDVSREISDEEIRLKIQSEVRKLSRNRLMSLAERESYENQIFNSLRKLDILQDLLDDPEVTEIMVNGPENIFYEKYGCLYRWKKGRLSAERLADMIQQIAGNSNRVINESQPIMDARLADGSRVNIVLAPIALDGPCISIRKFPDKAMTLERMVIQQSISDEAAQMLIALVQAGYNIFISGGTGSGKTTFLNALSEYIPERDRVVTIEDSAELQLKGIENLVRMEVRLPNGQGVTPIGIRDLIRTALRMRPDRIIVGEVRGAEALDMLQAMNTGHDGSLSTGHANSSEDMLLRLETMVLMGMELPLTAIRRQIASGIDILIHLGRLRDRTRKVLQISEIDGMQQGEILLNPLFVFQETGYKGEQIHGFWKKENQLHHQKKLEEKGIPYEEI